MNNNKSQMLQDPFLNALRKEHVPVSIYLVNGIKLQGNIDSFDQYVILWNWLHVHAQNRMNVCGIAYLCLRRTR